MAFIRNSYDDCGMLPIKYVSKTLNHKADNKVGNILGNAHAKPFNSTKQ